MYVLETERQKDNAREGKPPHFWGRNTKIGLNRFRAILYPDPSRESSFKDFSLIRNRRAIGKGSRATSRTPN